MKQPTIEYLDKLVGVWILIPDRATANEVLELIASVIRSWGTVKHSIIPGTETIIVKHQTDSEDPLSIYTGSFGIKGQLRD